MNTDEIKKEPMGNNNEAQKPNQNSTTGQNKTDEALKFYEMLAKKKESPAKQIIFKTLTAIVVSIFLLIPLEMSKSLIEDRQDAYKETENNVGKKWGTMAKLMPVFKIPYQTTNGDAVSSSYAFIFPSRLDAEINLNCKPFSVDRYEVPAYTADIKLKCELTKLEETIRNTAYSQIKDSELQILTNGAELVILNSHDYDCEVISTLSLNASPNTDSLSFDNEISINGYNSFSFVPSGKYNIKISGNRFNPSFLSSSILPNERSTNDSLFSANWQGTITKRYTADEMSDLKRLISYNVETLSVSLLNDMPDYRMAERTTKYAMLVIALTFVAFILIDLCLKRNINPLNYILTGLALVLFYTLLLSIYEYISFGWAYLIAAVMTIGLLSAYTAMMFKRKRSGIILGSILSLLYLYIYILVSIDRYSLIAGSVGLFIILAIVMFTSQKVINAYEKKK